MTDDDRADDIVGRVRERLDSGEDVDPEAVIGEHPDLAGVLRRRLAVLDRLERVRTRPGAERAIPPRRSLCGAALGPYRLCEEIGSGGMGTVYLATVEGAAPGASAGDRVAVKVVHPHLVSKPAFLERFRREAEIGRRIRHPNVVRTLDAGEAAVDGDSVHFVAMEHVEGRTLRALLEEMGRVPEELCRHVGREIARALGAIHAAGAVHRDVKPDNVLITPQHVVKVMDLGVARIDGGDGAKLSQTGAFVGSIQYGAPEQFRSAESVDARTDLHALGLTLYELATGLHPFAGGDVHVVLRRLLDEKPRRCGEVHPQLSPLFEELLAQLLEKDRDRRPASADDVARILEEGEDSAWWQARAAAIRAETHRPLRRMRIPRETALFGRDAELAKLRALFERAKAGDGQVVLLEGEAGIGKSRLVDEFVGALAQAGEDVDFVFGSYPPGGAATASGAFSAAYRERFGDDEAALRQALPQTPLLVPAFAALLRGDIAPEGAEPLTKDSLQTVFVHATRSLAAARPTIVLIDDLHFSPEEGRALFASLALAVPRHRIVLVGTARPSVPEKWLAQIDALEHATRLALPRLGAKDLVLLLRDALRSDHLAEELAAKIAVKSDGNPFFVLEILRGLREGQFLTRRPDGTWATTKLIRDIQVPSSITDLIQARISDLGPDDRNLLEVASCIGFEFDPALVGVVLHTERIPVLQHLGRIEKTHRLVRSAGRRFVFDHHQVQETLYAGLSELLREEYHASIASAIEDRSGAASADVQRLDGSLCVDLAEHFLKGAHGERALRYLDAALTHLEHAWRNEAAVALAERALAAPGLVGGRVRCEMLLRKAEPLNLIGRRAEERAALDEAIALADAIGDGLLRVRARNRLAGHLGEGADPVAAERICTDAVTLARSIGDRAGESLAVGNLGVLLKNVGRHEEARRCQEQRLAFVREIGDRRGEAIALGNLGNLHASAGCADQAAQHYRDQLGLAREIGDERIELNALASLGQVLVNAGQDEEAQAHLESALVVAQRIAFRAGEVKVRLGLALPLIRRGRCSDARAHLEGCLAAAQEIGDQSCEAAVLGNLGVLDLALGRADEGTARYARQRAIARKMGDPYYEAYAVDGLACAVAASGDAGAAESLFREALAMRCRSGGQDEVADTLTKLGALLADMDRAQEAWACLAEALDLAQKVDDAAVVVRAAGHLALLPGSDATAARAALAAHEGRLELAGKMEADFLLWRASRDCAHLAEAKRLLDFLVEHAPADCRESMLTNVRLHREILAAWQAESGAAPEATRAPSHADSAVEETPAAAGRPTRNPLPSPDGGRDHQ